MKKAAQRDLFPGALEMMILQILKRQPMHVYALVQQIKRTSQDLLQIEEGSLLSSAPTPSQGGVCEGGMGRLFNKPSCSYKLTAAGAKHLKREVSSFEHMLKGVTQVLAPEES
jgi:DNA-binding PadR family transcriptional regulator